LRHSVDGSVLLFETTGLRLRALYDHRIAAAKDDANDDAKGDAKEDEAAPEAWTQLRTPPTHLAAIAWDPAAAQRLVGGDREGVRGVLLHEPAGSEFRVEAAAGEEPEAQPSAPPDEPAKPPGPVEVQAVPPTLRAFSVSPGQGARLWALGEGKGTHAAGEASHALRAVATCPAGTAVLSGGGDGMLRRWGGEDAAAVSAQEVGGPVVALVAAPDMARAYVAVQGAEAIVAVPLSGAGDVTRFGAHAGGVTALARSDDAARLYSGGRDGQVRVWDTGAGMEVLSFAAGGEVRALTVARDGSRIYALNATGALKAYDPSGAEVASADLGAEVSPVLVVSPDGAHVLVPSGGGVAALGAQDLKPVRTFVASANAVTALAISPDGAWVLAGDAVGGMWLWHIGASEARWSDAQAHTGPVAGVGLWTVPAAQEPGAPGQGEPAPPGEGAPAPAPGEGTPGAGGDAPPGGADPAVPPGPADPGAQGSAKKDG